MAKVEKNAVELANMIRSRLAESKIRVAVFADANGGWHAMVYSEQGSVRDMQKRVDEIAGELSGIYDLGVLTFAGFTPGGFSYDLVNSPTSTSLSVSTIFIKQASTNPPIRM